MGRRDYEQDPLRSSERAKEHLSITTWKLTMK